MAKKILVIEDEEELGHSIKKFLEGHNYQVSYFSELSRVESIGVENPNLIITDLLLPRVHGFDICKLVKSDPSLSSIPLIVMTAVYKDAFHKLEAMRLGVEEFIEKPFRLSDLLGRVEKIIGPAAPAEESSEIPLPQWPWEKAKTTTPPPPVKEVKTVTEVRETKAAKVEATPPAKEKPRMVPEEAHFARSTPEKVTEKEAKRREQMILDELQEMKIDEEDNLAQKILGLEQIWEDILRGRNARQRLVEFREKIRGLTTPGPGSSIKDINENARQLEVLVDMIITEGERTIPQRKDKINNLLDNIRHHPLVSTELDVMKQLGVK